MHRFWGLAALLLPFLAGCGSNSTENSTTGTTGTTGAPQAAGKTLKQATLTLNWIPYGEHAPFYYGLEKGFYRDEGIDLTIAPGGGSGKTVQAVGGGQSTFGYADTPALIKAVAKGMPVKSIGVFLQTTPSSVEFFTDKNIKTPADLKGKTIAVTAGDAVSQTFPAFLAANKMGEADVTLVNVDAAGKIAALMAGKVDAITGFFHDQAPTIESKSGKKVSVLRYADFGVNFLGTGLLAANDTLKNDPELVRAFLKASIRSWEAAQKDPAGAVAAMQKRAEQAPKPEVLAKQLERSLTLLHSPATKARRPGLNDAADWQATINVLTKYAGLQNAGKPADYWTADFSPAK